MTPSLPFLFCFLLASASDGVQAVDEQTSTPGTVAGTYYSAVQTDIGVTMFSTVVIPSGVEYFVNATFVDGEFPYQCGDRLRRCNLTIVRENPGTREIVVAPLDQGVGLTLFIVSMNHTTVVDQYVVTLSDFEPTLSCNFTSFIDTVDPRHVDDAGYTLYGFCYNFLPKSLSDEVEMWIFAFIVNFNQLNDSRLELLYRDNSPYRLSSTGLSNPFLFGSHVCSIPAISVVWYDDAFLYLWRTDTGTFTDFDSEQSLCYGNNVTQVKLFLGSQLLAYCANNTVVEIDVCTAGGLTVPSLASPTRFYCSNNDNMMYLEQKGDVLMLILSNRLEIAIPHPLNTSLPYVADCVDINGLLFFVGSSVDGAIVLTDVLNNSTTILSTDTTVPHQVIQNRYILYSNATSSALLDMTCLSPTRPIHVFIELFNLANFSPNDNFSCLSVQPTEPTMNATTEETMNKTTTDIFDVTTDDITVTTEQTTSMVAAGGLSGGVIVGIIFGVGVFIFVVVVAVVIIILVMVVKCIQNKRTRHRVPIVRPGMSNMANSRTGFGEPECKEMESFEVSADDSQTELVIAMSKNQPNAMFSSTSQTKTSPPNLDRPGSSPTKHPSSILDNTPMLISAEKKDDVSSSPDTELTDISVPNGSIQQDGETISGYEQSASGQCGGRVVSQMPEVESTTGTVGSVLIKSFQNPRTTLPIVDLNSREQPNASEGSKDTTASRHESTHEPSPPNCTQIGFTLVPSTYQDTYSSLSAPFSTLSQDHVIHQASPAGDSNSMPTSDSHPAVMNSVELCSLSVTPVEARIKKNNNGPESDQTIVTGIGSPVQSDNINVAEIERHRENENKEDAKYKANKLEGTRFPSHMETSATNSSCTTSNDIHSSNSSASGVPDNDVRR